MSKMKNYQDRVDFWSDQSRLNRFDDKWINAEIITALDHLEIFNCKDVLEIGPGIGRQFTMFKEYTNSYELADISSKVLDNDIYKLHYCNVIKTWSDRLKVKYDIITFWFVIHHVTYDEIGAMIKFCYRHLRPKGLVIFNSPIKNQSRKMYKANGMRTTPWADQEVITHFKRGRFKVIEGPIECKNDELYIIQK